MTIKPNATPMSAFRIVPPSERASSKFEILDLMIPQKVEEA